MAHLVELRQRCQYGACCKVAHVEVFNDYNASLGVFCRPHGEAKLRALQARLPLGRPGE